MGRQSRCYAIWRFFQQELHSKLIGSNGNAMIKYFSSFVPDSLLQCSGSVFYSGKNAFSNQSKLYVLGLNPGGSPSKQANETVEWHMNQVLLKEPADWSAYQDECWLGKPPGTHGLQPRVLHLLNKIGENPHHTPSSNVVFVRSAREEDLKQFCRLAEMCWPFHQQVIAKLGVRIILCFGKKAGAWVCRQLKANRLGEEFIENNNRRWKSCVYFNEQGIAVVVATHPSRADWINPSSDPTPLVKRLLCNHHSKAEKNETNHTP